MLRLLKNFLQFRMAQTTTRGMLKRVGLPGAGLFGLFAGYRALKRARYAHR